MSEIFPEQPMVPSPERRVIDYGDPGFLAYCDTLSSLQREYYLALEKKATGEANRIGSEINTHIIQNPDLYADYSQAQRDAQEQALEQFNLDRAN